MAQWQVLHDFNDKPLRQEVVQWIKMSWLEIKDSTIQNTWKHIGFQAQETHNITINMEANMEAEMVERAIRTDTGSVNDEK